MQIAATSNRFLTNCSSIELLAALQTGSRHGEFYQQVAQLLIKGFHTKEALIQLGQRLTALTQHAFTLRQIDNVEQASQILMNLPLAEYRKIGLYYYALAIRRRGQAAQAESLLERVADDAPTSYRGQALLSLGTFALISGKRDSALRYYTEALRVASKKDLLITARTLKMIAVAKGIDGDHNGAIADLESLLPAVRAVSVWYPEVLCDYSNSLAVELCEAGRLQEARSVSHIALASPYASAYPEYRETWDEIQLRGYRTPRSVVAITRKSVEPDNLARLPVPEAGGDLVSPSLAPERANQPARVLSYMDWKKNMVKQPNDTPHDRRPSKELTGRQLLLRIMEITSSKEMTDEELREMVDALERIKAKHEKRGNH
ncbi:MAG TPA: hypothetical protein VKA70_07405 [Blastocatellia bacterium]|nr:hypothetical protein [Blastocatellia bacterium]